MPRKNKGGRTTFRKIITSPELLEQINPENTKLVDRFLKNMSTKSSPKTVLVYRSNFNIFFTWVLLFDENKAFTDLKVYDFMDFFDYAVMELKWSSNRFAQMHSSLCSLSHWIERIYYERYPDFRILVDRIEKPPKEAVRKKSVFSKDELDRLMNWLGEQGKPQEQCLLALIMGSGSRASELVRFTTNMIDENHTAFEDLFLETTEEIKVKGRGVDGKHIPKYIIKDIFMPYYNRWLVEREKIMQEHNQSHNAIFIRPDGSPAAETTIRSWMVKWDEVLQKHWYPHAGRHFWCTYLLSIGLDRELVQSLQSWSSADMTDLYNDMTAKDRQWKNLDKLRSALEQESLNQELDEIENESSNEGGD